MSAAPLRRCRVCGSKVNRMFYPVGIAFKGPGFYASDNRTGSKSPTFGDTVDRGDQGDKGDKGAKGRSDDKRDGAAKPDAGEVKAAKPDHQAKPSSDTKAKTGSAAGKH